jgi:hypothetical protein
MACTSLLSLLLLVLVQGVLWQIFYFYSIHTAQLLPKRGRAVGGVNPSKDRQCLDKHTDRSKPVLIDDSLYLLTEEDFLHLVVDFTLTSTAFK